MYKAYYEKKDNASRRTFIYMSVLFYFIFLMAFLFLERIMLNMNFTIDWGFMKERTFWYVLIVPIGILTYFLFSIKDFNYYEDKFLGKHKLNKIVKLWMLVILPIFILFFGLFIFGLFFGGEFLGKSFTGLWK